MIIYGILSIFLFRFDLRVFAGSRKDNWVKIYTAKIATMFFFFFASVFLVLMTSFLV